jgi:hypothetical protein
MSEIILIRGSRHVVWECRTCGCVSTCPEVVNEQLSKVGGYRSCPNGHQWGWNKEASEDEKIRRERDRLKQETARLEEEIGLTRVRAEKAEATTKRLKKRSSAGTCPCCSRTFANMAEHMKHQHPQFVADGGAKVLPIKRGARA